MKLRTLALSMCIPLLHLNYSYSAPNKISSKLDSQNIKSSKSRTIGLSTSIKKEKIELGDTPIEKDLNLSGFEIGLSKLFFLDYGITTTTELATSYSTAKKDLGINDDEEIFDKFEIKKLEIGVSQKFSYNIHIKNERLTPFIGVGVYRGKISFNSNLAEIENSEIEMNVKYTNLELFSGIEYSFTNGVTPFVKYSISKMSFDKEVEFEGKLNGNIIYSETNNEGSDLNSTASKITFGMGYLF